MQISKKLLIHHESNLITITYDQKLSNSLTKILFTHAPCHATCSKFTFRVSEEVPGHVDGGERRGRNVRRRRRRRHQHCQLDKCEQRQQEEAEDLLGDAEDARRRHRRRAECQVMTNAMRGYVHRKMKSSINRR